MSSFGQAFEVATEFRFDVGEALVNTKALQSAVGDLSKTANNALSSLNFLAMGLVTRLGLGSGGLLSFFSRAIELSEDFNVGAMGFVNNISSNFGVLRGNIDTFNGKLSTSKMLMDNVGIVANKYGLSGAELARTTTMISTPLANSGKLGTNYGNAINMAKNVMLGSEAVGINPQVASESLYRALTEHMPLHGALFSRLVNTPEFKQAHIGTQQQFIALGQDKKIDLLSRSLERLGGDSDFLNARLSSLRVQFDILKNQVDMVLKPIGEAVGKPIAKIFSAMSDYLRKNGSLIGKNIGLLIGNIFEDPKSLAVSLMQLSHLKSDFKKAADWGGILVTLSFLKVGLEKIGIVFGGGLIRRAFVLLMDGVGYLMSGLSLIGPYLMKLASFIGPYIGEFLSAFTPLLLFFQIISRARAVAKVADIQNMIELTPRLTALALKFKTAIEYIFTPITMCIDFFGDLFAPLFETTTWLKLALPLFEFFADILNLIGTGMVLATATFSGFAFAVFGFIDDIMKLKNPFTNFKDNFNTGIDDFLKNHPLNKGDIGGAVVNNITNIGSQNIRFDMKEQMEPDRIAFAVTDHLKKLASNPRQGRGQSLSAAFGGAHQISGK